MECFSLLYNSEYCVLIEYVYTFIFLFLVRKTDFRSNVSVWFGYWTWVIDTLCASKRFGSADCDTMYTLSIHPSVPNQLIQKKYLCKKKRAFLTDATPHPLRIESFFVKRKNVLKRKKLQNFFLFSRVSAKDSDIFPSFFFTDKVCFLSKSSIWDPSCFKNT